MFFLDSPPAQGLPAGGVWATRVVPDGRRLLRVEARNAETPIERKPSWIRTTAKMGPEFTALHSMVKSEGSTPFFIAVCSATSLALSKLGIQMTPARDAASLAGASGWWARG